MQDSLKIEEDIYKSQKMELFVKRSWLYKRYRQFILKCNFQPSFIAIFFNPFYISRKNLYKKITQVSKRIKGGNLLDLGCGIKPYEKLFNVDSYIGIDVEGGGHSDRAKEANKYYNGKVIPFKDGRFDILLCTQVLEHTDNPQEFLKEANRVMKNKGNLILTAPFVWSEHEIPYDFFRYTQYGLKYLLTRSGFKIVGIEKTCGVFETAAQLISSFLAGLTRNWFLYYFITIFISSFVQLNGIILDILFKHKGIGLDYIVIAKKYI